MEPLTNSIKLIYNTWTVVGAVFSLFFIHVIWNITLHPLASHPGPILWAATRIPWAWNQCRGKLNHRLVELHSIYGPVVRVAPDEISYTTENAWKTIYGHRSIEMCKDPNFSLLTPGGVQNILTADRETHTRQRRVLSHAFSNKALKEQEQILKSYCSKLCNQLEAFCASGPVDIVDWFTFATFDLIGDLAFGQGFGCLESGIAAPFVNAIKTGSRELTLNQLFRYYQVFHIRKLISIFWPYGSSGAREANLKRATEVVRARVARGPTADRRDFWHYVLQHLAEEVIETEEGSKTFKSSMSEPEMFTNAFSISIAGSEGTATALSGTMFLLLRHPTVYHQVVSEIRGAFHSKEEITIKSTSEKLPFTDAVLREAMRLYPPVAITLPRRVPAGGETIEGRFVPEGYIVGVNHLACYHSEQNFKDAQTFCPSRWLSVSDDQVPGNNAAVFQPFSHGPRSCLGKNLAWAEMKIIITHILWQFDVQLVDTKDSLNWLDQRIWGFWAKGPLLCQLTLLKKIQDY